MTKRKTPRMTSFDPSGVSNGGYVRIVGYERFDGKGPAKNVEPDPLSGWTHFGHIYQGRIWMVSTDGRHRPIRPGQVFALGCSVLWAEVKARARSLFA